MLSWFITGVATGAIAAFLFFMAVLFIRSLPKKKGHGFPTNETMHVLSANNEIISKPRHEHAVEDLD